MAYSVSTVLAGLGFIYVLYFPIRIAYLIKNGDLQDKAFRSKYGGLYEVYKEEDKTAAFEVFILIKKLLIAFSLVFLGGHSFVQLFTIIIYSAIYYFLLDFWKPYKLEKANTFFRKSELMMVLGFILMLIVAFKGDELPVNFHKTIGWVCTYIFAIGLLRKLQIFFRKNPKKELRRVRPKLPPKSPKQ